jgi:pimeloyl-ACP methyl ester carboxylesterase
MPTTRSRRTLTVALAAALLAVAACSSDDDRPDEPSPQRSATESAGAGDSGQADRAVPDAPPLEPLPEQVPADLQRYYEQELSWSPCGPSGFECATLTVPLDYERPDAADDIQLTVTRSAATGPGERIGSLVMNPGGPGASAVDFVHQAGEIILAPDVRAQYDMVGLDPRGTGQSEPVSCLAGEAMDEYTRTDRTPDDQAEVEALRAAYEDFAAACQQRSGELLEHISTIESARDMDVLRAVLGDDQLQYLGFSYGTKLGAVYAGLFPQRAGRLVLDAAIDPRLPTRTTDREQAGGFETAFRAFAEDCVTQSDCPLGTSGPDDASQRLVDLFDQVDAEPLPTNDPERPLTESLTMTGVAYALYNEASWPMLRSALTSAIDGDGGPLLEMADAYNERTADGSYGTTTYAFPAISCLDSPAGMTDPAAVQRQLPAYTEASPTFGRDFAWATLLCAAWPVEPTGHPVTIDAAGSEDILVVGTTRDPATPYVWAEGLADQLDAGILLTHEGDGHTAYGTGDSCVDRTVNAYLLENTSPEDGTTCS